MTPPQGQAQDSSQSERLDVVIAGAGVAGLEAAFALREPAGDRVALTWLAPTDEFVYRPMTVGEPFTSRWARHYPLSGLAAGVGAAVVHDALSAVEVQRRVAITSSGSELSYDALLVGPGASLHRRFQHGTTVDDTQMDELLRGVVQDIEDGYVSVWRSSFRPRCRGRCPSMSLR